MTEQRKTKISMVRWVVEIMYIEVTSDYKFVRCGGSDREKKKKKRFRKGR